MKAASTSRTTGQAMVDKTPKYDRVFNRKPKAGRPRRQDHAHKQFWVK